MTATNITRTVGIEKANINVGTDTTLNATADSTTKADDLAVSGDASATAGTEAQAAILNSTISVGQKANLTALEKGILDAKAGTTTGDATASASNDGPTGGIINTKHHPNQIGIGTDAVLTATADNTATAAATSVDGYSTATADTGQVFGLKNVGVNAGMGTSLDASAKGVMTATANSVGLSTDDDGSSATAGGYDTKVVGIYGSGGRSVIRSSDNAPTPAGSSSDDYGPAKALEISFGKTGTLSSFAEGALNSTATGVTGEALASSEAKLVAGIAVGLAKVKGDGDGQPEVKSVGGMKISFGEDGTVASQGQVDANATATTVTGPAAATVGIKTIGGIVDLNQLSCDNDAPQSGPTTLSIGKDGDVQAAAIGTSIAKAKSVTAPPEDDVTATTNHGTVAGIAIDKLTIGENATRLFAQAFSDQSATAESITSGGDPAANAANGDLVVGIYDTTVKVGKDATAPTAEASLSATATASGITTTVGSTAVAGDGSKVVGFNKGSLEVGQNVLGVFKATGAADLAATASAVSGDSTAQAGGDDDTGTTSKVIGLSHAPVSIGKAGSVDASGIGTVQASATSVTGDAYADALQKAVGIKDSKITIGTDGNALGKGELTGIAKADTTTGNANAEVELAAKGIDNDVLISIGMAGNVTGTAKALDAAVATAVTGDADASSELKGIGIDLKCGSPITIGTKGNISGSGTASAVNVLATTTTGDATLELESKAVGINGGDSGSSVTAGPQAGNIEGIGIGSAKGLANTVTGNAEANTEGDVKGIYNTDLVAGLIGVNSIKANGTGTYDTKATAVTGDATANGIVKVAGLLGDCNSAKLSGNVDASAILTNTVFASTVTGSATANAHGDAVGIGGYHINILQSGNITASAVSNSLAQAQSVTV